MPQRTIDGRIVDIPSFEFPPEVGAETSMGRAHDFMAGYRGSQASKYDILRDAFGDDEDPLQKWGEDGVLVILRGALGRPSDIAEDLSQMSAADRARDLDDPVIADLVELYSTFSDEEIDNA